MLFLLNSVIVAKYTQFLQSALCFEEGNMVKSLHSGLKENPSYNLFLSSH